MNKFRFTVNNGDTYINLPVEINFDNFGREDLIKQYENDVLEEIINPVEDFETTRYSAEFHLLIKKCITTLIPLSGVFLSWIFTIPNNLKIKDYTSHW